MRSSSSSSGKAGCDRAGGGRLRLSLSAFAMAGLAWVITAGTSSASLSPDEAPRIAAGTAFHRGDLAYRRHDYAAALQWFRAAGDRGDAAAQNYVGWLYANGLGTQQDYAEALRWYRRSAGQGNPGGENYLGWMYQHGWGVPQDDVQAMSWYRKAAEQGSAEAARHIGFLYRNGRGVATDYAEAMRWFRKAAEKGDATAESSIGWMYQSGLGVAGIMPRRCAGTGWPPSGATSTPNTVSASSTPMAGVCRATSAKPRAGCRNPPAPAIPTRRTG